LRPLLVDRNVVLDVLLRRELHLATSAAVWAAVERQCIAAMLPAHGVTTIFYLAAKALGREAARRVVSDLLLVFAVAPIDTIVLRRAASTSLADFEDAVTAAAAEAAGCDFVVTRDPSGFAGSGVPAITPGERLAMLGSEVQEPPPAYARRRRVRRVARG
jgi:predicted nucleic acid-binding protein